MSRIWTFLAGLGAAVVALFFAFRKGGEAADTRNKAERQKVELEAHERITNADTGGGANDAERIRRLRELGRALNGD
jgi:hypothetical protein